MEIRIEYKDGHTRMVKRLYRKNGETEEDFLDRADGAVRELKDGGAIIGEVVKYN